MNVHIPARLETGGVAVSPSAHGHIGVACVSPGPLPADLSSSRSDGRFVRSFGAERATVPVARKQLENWLRTVGLENSVDAVALLASELMANAVVHGCRGLRAGTELTLTAVWSDRRLRVEVQDPSGAEPLLQSRSESRTSGRGLQLVDALSDRWGVTADPGGCGKTVWAECDDPLRERAG
ncbi:ATP-binding protein [Streptomyces acidiscabies]|uniref:ATP-binding protein n=1 Tax=Streptomyces acidiscabies TaxID=42234 RepID=A0ABU4MCI2_9ACTN|nr:ATP-binding protein [Streptomyces acidiscabies]MDX3024922.1 ATP-binding protein [Streptomyces acidiscabies]